MQDYEKLGAFYLGRRYDLAANRVASDEPLLYDAKDLTHPRRHRRHDGQRQDGPRRRAARRGGDRRHPRHRDRPEGRSRQSAAHLPRARRSVVSRPGSTRPRPRATAARPTTEAQSVAERWREGLAEWGQPPERIARFAAAAERAIYTPGIARRPAARAAALARRAAAAPSSPTRTRCASASQSTASGLLGLLGVDADPLRSREHILLATLLDRAWRDGKRPRPRRR